MENGGWRERESEREYDGMGEGWRDRSGVRDGGGGGGDAVGDGVRGVGVKEKAFSSLLWHDTVWSRPGCVGEGNTPNLHLGLQPVALEIARVDVGNCRWSSSVVKSRVGRRGGCRPEGPGGFQHSDGLRGVPGRLRQSQFLL